MKIIIHVHKSVFPEVKTQLVNHVKSLVDLCSSGTDMLEVEVQERWTYYFGYWQSL